MPDIVDKWFVDQILIHEEALMRFLIPACANGDEAHDLRQDIYERVYQAAGQALPAHAKAFLFTTARNLLTDRARRAKVVSIETMGDFDPSLVLIDDVSPERWSGGRQALKHLSEAFDLLPDRCREVVWLRRVEELSQKDVAARLGITEKTVEKHIVKGMRLLADYWFGGQTAHSAPDLASDSRHASAYAE